jgi:hypothetical protein
MSDMDGHGSTSRLQPDPAASQARVSSTSPGLPHHRRFDESWVEVSSQPSSSSLSSIGDEIVTTGLRVGGPFHRRRRLQASTRSMPQQQTAIHNAGTSSQEEYDESESDDDHVLTSSNENVQTGLHDSDAGSESDDGDNATALGRASDRPPVFRPQPNAFSHPPAYIHQRSHSTNTAIPSHPHSGFTRPSFSQRSQTRVHRSGPNFMSPSAREDNDAALRASLTTLLSCAAAARGLPKSKEEAEAQRAAANGVGPSTQPVELRLVPESELLHESPPAQPSPRIQSRRRTPPTPLSPCTDAAVSTDKPKRPTSTSRSPRAAKKKRTASLSEDTLVSPTLLTWVVSAGVVVLVSVVGFGAGYVIGREVGKQEGLATSIGSVNETASCGREVMRTSGGTLRRFRWGDVGRSIVAQS